MASLMDSPGLTIGILVALVCFSAFFSASETAVSCANKVRLKNKAEAGSKRAAQVLTLMEEYDRVLSCILIANNIVNITASSLATLFFVTYFPRYGASLSTVVLTVVILIFGEITPKTLAKTQPERFALFSVPFLRFFVFLLTPLNAFFALFCKLASLAVRNKGDDGITKDELITMVEEAESEGGLEPHESELIRAAIEFNDLEVAEILTPRVDIEAAEDTISMQDLAIRFAESGYSRIPIYQGTVDNIIGVIHEKDFYAARYHQHFDIPSLLSKVYYTTGSAKISDLLRLLQRSKTHMAIVVDAYGGTEGLVTMEDILEELVGEIWDEHDEVIESFRPQPDGSYLISCSANLDDLFDRFSLRGSGESSSIGGWVLESLGRLPTEGDSFTYENLLVTVTKVDNRRVLEISVTVKDEAES